MIVSLSLADALSLITPGLSLFSLHNVTKPANTDVPLVTAEKEAIHYCSIVIFTIRVHSLPKINVFTARNEVGARLCFYRCVILFTGGGTWPGTPPKTRYTPPDQVHPPGTRYPPDQVHPPGTRYTSPRDQVHPPGPGTPPWDQVHPLGPDTPPGPGTPPPAGTRYTPPLGPGTPPPHWDQVHPWDQGDTVYARAVRILLECILVSHYYLSVSLCLHVVGVPMWSLPMMWLVSHRTSGIHPTCLEFFTWDSRTNWIPPRPTAHTCVGK